MKKTKMEPTFDEALDVCIQYYVDRGNTVELATLIVNRGEKEVLELYHLIQEEKNMPKNLSTIVDLKDITGGDKNENAL